MLAVFALSLGTIAGRRLQGSCGGIANGSCACSPTKRARCEAKAQNHAPEGSPDVVPKIGVPRG